MGGSLGTMRTYNVLNYLPYYLLNVQLCAMFNFHIFVSYNLTAIGKWQCANIREF